ncbi:maltokinase N-terminal cap-like domain-containing protein [Aestuariimicrobium ganziense]|uniref:maltokinase N-terminal cap-like domain-containing protein n=1 Tax=Aestuariimicrobium ganziense TaxID=2773677 RepID=UPI00194316A6|nr:phosphotransferase [Aestuariimicrobium ganziense]
MPGSPQSPVGDEQVTESGDVGLWAAFDDARWFGGKGRDGRCVSVTPLDWYGPGPGDASVAVRSEVATIAYPDGGVEDYQLLVSYRHEVLPEAELAQGAEVEGAGRAHDALRDPEALALYVTAIARQAETPSWSAVVRQSDALQGAVRVFGGEQSNTSLMVGTSSMVKLFRKLEHGHNLDIAVHDALGRSGVSVAAALHGWVEGRVAPGDRPAFRTDLAMVVEQLREAADGWDLATASAHDGTDFTDQARALGRSLASVHQALADTFPAGRVDGRVVADTMERRLEAATKVAPVLAEHAPALRQLFDGLRGMPLNVQQIHGDFHLGQTLSTPHGWRIIDFEGEPMKTLSERAEPDSKWRDVAGMVRSFSYATSGADDPSSPAARAWGEATTEAFLAGYSSSITAAQRAALDAYTADKAIYEVVYETRNRPSWVHIPMRAIVALTERN